MILGRELNRSVNFPIETYQYRLTVVGIPCQICQEEIPQNEICSELIINGVKLLNFCKPCQRKLEETLYYL